MGYVFAAPSQAVVPVDGTTDLFPVHRVYCVGRNYAEHAREMGFSGREAPFFFTKPADAVVPIAFGAVGKVPYPPATESLHHEVELVVALGRSGESIHAADAQQHIYGYAVGVDLTRRDLQAAAKEKGRPWDVAKGFDSSAPISPIKPVAVLGEVADARLWLNVNGERRQAASTSQMIWSIAETIEHLSRYFRLQAGDLIFTGTPEGVGAVKRGDQLEAGLERLGTVAFTLV